MVVSIANVSPAHAYRYYTEGKRNVSQTDKPMPELSSSEWYGNGSKALGMAQPVQSADLNQLLSGKLPDGTTLVDKTRCQQQQANAKATGKPAPTERAGLDLTASAPKSISLQALIFGDRKLEAAHQQANREMLKVLENRYAYTRITEQGKRLKVCTEALAIACFHHDASRALDPQLHTHNVILNLQRNPKTGRWQSLDNTEIYKAKMLLGQIYRNELACAVQDLGYTIHITNQQHGLWELNGFTATQLRSFSTRINQIEGAVGVGVSSKAQAWANRVTRPTKVEYDRDEMERYWQQQAQASGLTPLQPQPAPIRSETVHQPAIAQAMQWLSEWLERSQALDRRELERKALQRPGILPFSALGQMIDTYLSNNFVPLIGTSQHVFQRVQGVLPKTDCSTDSGSTQQLLSGESHPQPSNRATTQEISEVAPAIAPLREFTVTNSQFLSDIAHPPEANAAWAHGTTGSNSDRNGNSDRDQPEQLYPSHERADYPVAADASEVGDPAAGEQFDCRPQTTSSEHDGVGTDAGRNGEAVRLGQEFRALGELVAQVIERHERRTMVRTEDEARSDDPCPDRYKYNPPQKPSAPDTNHLVKSLEADNLELEREQ